MVKTSHSRQASTTNCKKQLSRNLHPGFAPNSECLYVGDTTEKDLVKNVDKLHALGFEITLHDKMPDVVLYAEDKDWLYFIESVTSVGPMEPKRIKEIEEMTTGVKAGKIYVTAFLDFKTFKQFSESLAWETEVWIADMPDHMIHLNGDKFWVRGFKVAGMESNEFDLIESYNPINLC